MKRIYFVRHGESEGNIGSIRQTAATSLTDKGRMQAEDVGERCAKLPIEVVISSTMNRAKETCEIILKHINKKVEYSELFVERRRPSEVLGKPKDDSFSLKAEEAILKNYHLPGFRFSDEENFEDQKERAKAALEYLANRPEQNILVVTHGFILRIIMAYVVFGEKLTGEECTRFIQTFRMANTGITAFDYKEDGQWKLWTWNDHAHLG
jgi:broad specificity phosphatase PhoE